MGDTTITGKRFPVISDSPDVPRDALAIVTDFDPQVVQRFNTTTERDAAFAVVAFKECWVGNVKYYRVGSDWVEAPGGVNWGSVRAYRSAAQAVITSSWVSLGITGSDFNVGSGLSAHPEGVLVTAAGTYHVDATLVLPGAGTGVRQLGVSTSASVGLGNFEIGTFQGAAGSGDQRLNAGGLLQVGAGQIIRLWARQTSGSTVNATDRWLMVTRVA